jgi:hypothetical protein
MVQVKNLDSGDQDQVPLDQLADYFTADIPE